MKVQKKIERQSRNGKIFNHLLYHLVKVGFQRSFHLQATLDFLIH